MFGMREHKIVPPYKWSYMIVTWHIFMRTYHLWWHEPISMVILGVNVDIYHKIPVNISWLAMFVMHGMHVDRLVPPYKWSYMIVRWHIFMVTYHIWWYESISMVILGVNIDIYHKIPVDVSWVPIFGMHGMHEDRLVPPFKWSYIIVRWYIFMRTYHLWWHELISMVILRVNIHIYHTIPVGVSCVAMFGMHDMCEDRLVPP